MGKEMMETRERSEDTDLDLLDGDEDESQENKYLTFRIESEVYGINVLDVVEILRMISITPIPESLPYIRGIINLRGKIIPVMDVRLRFGLEEKQADDRTCIIVVNMKGVDIGLVVDTVAEVIEIPVDQIDAMPAVHQSGHQKFIRGIGKVDDSVKILLELEKMVNEEEIKAVL